MRRVALAIVILLLLCAPVWATTYYVDATSGDDENAGTSHAAAWQTVTEVNSSVSGSGDEVYFLCGETWQDAILRVDWDNATVGAYYMDGANEVLGVNEDGRPTIDGQQDTLPASGAGEYQALVQIRGESTNRHDSIILKNLRIINSQFSGLNVIYATNVTVENCEIYRCGTSFATYDTGSSGIFQDNECHEGVLAFGQYRGFIDWWTGTTEYEGGVGWPGGFSATRTWAGEQVIVRRNWVYNTFGEGINLGRNSRNVIVEYNKIGNTASGGIYSDANLGGTIRYNLVYLDHTDETFPYYSHFTGGICESLNCGPGGIAIAREVDLGYSGDYYIYGNFVVGYCFGINIASGMNSGDNIYVYKNTIIKPYCEEYATPIRIFDSNAGLIEIKENIFGGTEHYIRTPTAATWDYNLWEIQPEADARGANDPGYSTYASQTMDFVKTSGWDSITHETVAIADFGIQATSDAVGAGTDLGGNYNTAIDVATSDFSDVPFTVNTISRLDYSQDIGAAVYTGGTSPPATGGEGTITFDAVSSGYSSGTVSSITVSHPVSADATFAAIGVTWRDNTAVTVSSVTCNGTTVTSNTSEDLTSDNADTYTKSQMFWVEDSDLPAGGTYDFVITMSSAVYNLQAVVITLEGAADQAPEADEESDDTDGGGTTSTSITTSTAGAWLIDLVLADGTGTATAGSNQTSRFNDSNYKRVAMSTKVVESAGADSMGWTIADDSNPTEHLVMAVAPEAGSAECTLDYEKSDGQDSTYDHARYNNLQLWGIIFDDGESGPICRVDWYMHSTQGTPSNNDYYVEIYLLDGSNNLDGQGAGSDEPIGRSDKADGDTWSAEFVTFTFSTPAAYDCTGTNQYAIVLKMVESDDAADAYGKYSETDYVQPGYDDENSGDSTQHGIGRWDSQNSGVFSGAIGSLDVEDDQLIIVYKSTNVDPVAPAKITDIGTWVSSSFSDSNIIDIGIGESAYIAFQLSRQVSAVGDPDLWRIAYTVDYPAATTYYGKYYAITGSDPYYAVFEIRGGYTFDGTRWNAVNAMRETADLAISGIDTSLGGYLRDGDGNDLQDSDGSDLSSLAAHTDPGTVTVSCPGVFSTTDPTGLTLIDGDTIVITGGSANWTPTVEELVIDVRAPYSGDVNLSGVDAPCQLWNPHLITGTLTEGSCTRHYSVAGSR